MNFFNKRKSDGVSRSVSNAFNSVSSLGSVKGVASPSSIATAMVSRATLAFVAIKMVTSGLNFGVE